MPTITFVRENVQVEVPVGDSVRYPALENDVPVYCGMWKYANCHGNGLCGTDRDMRLACQIEVLGDVNVDTQCS